MTRRPAPELEEGSLAYWAELMTARGHAPVFARNSPRDKRIVERSTVREWIKAVEVAEKLKISELEDGPAEDFPDFYANLDGKSISIELTELLHSPHVLKAAAKRELRFDHIQWTPVHFRTRVQERVSSKAAQCSRAGRRCDVLILHTDEPWLSPHRTEQWLAENPFEPQEPIGAAYLLMTHVPDWAEHWPIFQLWGPSARG